MRAFWIASVFELQRAMCAPVRVLLPENGAPIWHNKQSNSVLSGAPLKAEEQRVARQEEQRKRRNLEESGASTLQREPPQSRLYTHTLSFFLFFSPPLFSVYISLLFMPLFIAALLKHLILIPIAPWLSLRTELAHVFTVDRIDLSPSERPRRVFFCVWVSLPALTCLSITFRPTGQFRHTARIHLQLLLSPSAFILRLFSSLTVFIG